MKRLRLLSALLACLAAVATGLPAFASVAAGPPSTVTISGVPSHCTDCPDCDGKRCAQAVDCTAPCATAISVLAVTSIGLARSAMSGRVWSSRAAARSGEHPPPEPLPPRA